MIGAILKIAAGVGLFSGLVWGAFAGLLAGALTACVLFGGFLAGSLLRG